MLSTVLIQEVQNLSMEEIRELDDLVRARWNTLKREKSRTAASNFKTGMSVQFQDKTGITIEGTIEKINRTSISVVTKFGMWRVHPSLLTEVRKG
jgi:hypothetical protein